MIIFLNPQMFYWIIFHNFIYIFPHHLSPLCPFPILLPSTPHNHHTVVHVHKFCFIFIFYPITPRLPTPPNHQSCALYDSVYILCDSSLSSLNSNTREIIWYLCLSLTGLFHFSRSIHSILKGKIFSLFMAE